jgi:hypothetical protein
MTAVLILKRASVSRPSGQWRDDDYDVLEKGIVVGRIFKVPVAPQGRPWMWARRPQRRAEKKERRQGGQTSETRCH